MSVLLGLRRMKLLQTILRNDVGQHVLGEGLREGHLHVLERLVVLRHRDEVRELRRHLALKAVEVLLGEGARHLTRAIGTEVEEDHRVAVAHALVVAGKRLDELIATLVLLVVGLNALNGIGIGLARKGDHIVGALDTLQRLSRSMAQ